MLRPHVQVTLAKPAAGVETHAPATHASSVHGSPSSQSDASPQDVAPGEDGAPGGGWIDPSILIGWLRAIGTGRCDPGSGLSSRSSYQPSGRSAGTRSGSWPAAAPRLCPLMTGAS